MKAVYRTLSGQLSFEVQGEGVKDLFQGIASIQEIFECEDKCGCCQSDEVRFRVRIVDGNDFYEKVCTACGANFSFGQKKDKISLYPKRREDGKALPNGGWAKYVKPAS